MFSVVAREGQFENAIFGAGCFWGVEDRFRHTPGVVNTVVGYAGGHVSAPTYEQVCSDTTGHAEVVKITFDPDVVSFTDLLRVFWDCHDPTTLNRQGPDVGSQYRSTVLCLSQQQLDEARQVLEQEMAPRFVPRTVVTELTLFSAVFWPAEDYHQQYFAKRRAQGLPVWQCH